MVIPRTYVRGRTVRNQWNTCNFYSRICERCEGMYYTKAKRSKYCGSCTRSQAHTSTPATALEEVAE